ncbi:MAG: PadR family transcriptional regulator, partial [Clostridia bacterium]|nr:PadR family transcriptional regulator [Clostridia bacterium]
MDISSVNSDLIRGNVTTIILGCLFNEDKYGYEILKEIEDKSHSQYALKQATLYNQLKRLEKQGLVNSYDGAPDDTGGGKRRYYALTSEGKAYLTKEKSEYEYSRTILDKLVSEKEFDFTKEIPFDASELRPYSKREPGEEKSPKVVYKEKIVEVENIVYIDLYGNRITEEEAHQAALQAMIDDEQARKNEKDLAEAREQLLALEQQRGSSSEQLLSFEEERAAYEAQLHAVELERAAKEEQLRLLEEERIAREEQLRIAEEERAAKEAQLRALEEERVAREERLHAAELDSATKEEQLRLLEE